MNVAVIGASDDLERYSYLAVKLLSEKGHTVFPVHPSLKDIAGLKVYASIGDVPETIDTVSLYVSPQISSRIAADILRKAPRRIIFNPDAENPALEKAATNQGIHVLRACTLTMLKTNQFD